MLASLWRLLSPAARRRFVGVLGLGAVASAADVIGIALVMAFMAQVSGADAGFAHGASHWLAMHFTPVGSGLAAGLMLALANLLGALALWATSRFAWGQERELCARLLSRYLRMPYAWFLKRHGALLARDVLGDSLASGIVDPAITMVRRSVSTLFVASGLFWVDPGVAAVAILFIALAYGALAGATRGIALRWGQTSHEAQRERLRAALETIAALKSVRLLGREDEFLARYDVQTERAVDVSSRLVALSHLPRYILETVAFGGIIALTVYLLAVGRSLEVLPMLSLYAMAGYRLIPAVHDVFLALTRVRFYFPVLMEFDSGLAETDVETKGEGHVPTTWDRIRVRDLQFAYESADRPVLDGVDLEVERHGVIGIVGRSGVGKTTLLDLMLGLLTPRAGRVEIGGVPLTVDNARTWQRQVGYAPQDVILADDTVLANIAFGIPPGQIDRVAVEGAARTAGLTDLIEQELADGYDTLIGERGARLSAGQRQRLSLARALYSNPEVLVLDEATSNLDGITEGVVMDAVRALGGRKTMIIVAHRLATVRCCERIYLLEDGRISASGSWNELAQQSELFAQMQARA